MGQGLAEEDSVAAFHFCEDSRGEGFVGGEPGQVEGVLLGGAVAGDGDDEGQGDGVLAGVVEGRDAGGGEVLGDGEGHGGGGDLREGHGAEVLLEVAEEGVADALVIEHAAGDELALDVPVAGGAQQEADGRHGSALVHAHGYGVDVEDGQALTRVVELFAAQPGGRAVDFEGTHGRDCAKGRRRSVNGCPVRRDGVR